MKKQLLLTLFVLVIFSGNAQQWCLPGAVWNYTFSSAGVNNTFGYTEIRYQGDSLIAGKNCNRLLYSRHASQFIPVFPSPQPQYKYLYTYASNGVVQLRTGATSFDTLFNVNAQPGDVWRFPRYGMSCGTFTNSKIYATVIDTGHVMIDTSNMRYIEVVYDATPWQGGTVSQSLTVLRFVDRVGCLNDFFYPYVWNCPNQTDTWPSEGKLTCFWNDDMSIYNTGLGICNYNYLSISESSKVSEFKLVPNPATSRVQIKSSASAVLYQIKDISGKLLLQTNYSNVSLEGFSAGLYFVTELSALGSKTVKLMVE